MAPTGIQTIQLRIKGYLAYALTTIIREATQITRSCNIRLFINDEWELAIRLGAYGIHLGQENLHTADLLPPSSLQSAKQGCD
ncbi:hypothetical protein BCY86_03430 [Pajaroellobacter abortibovis]|uniref:Thiamine phosphate synthase/TenI domain-containing protein n=1 Tax=Pajaroellobacter abortibovis TaxID=1882918 RepID=A0A1L6MWC6_9BACT|nr:hypothetical protein BCY86_03430 [Pajaroellobacter abortibovis]